MRALRSLLRVEKHLLSYTIPSEGATNGEAMEEYRLVRGDIGPIVGISELKAKGGNNPSISIGNIILIEIDILFDLRYRKHLLRPELHITSL
jgi:hypothetical protein